MWTLKFTNTSLKNPLNAFPLMWDHIGRISGRVVPVNMVAFLYYSRSQFHVKCQQEVDCHGIHLYQYVHLVGGTRCTYGLWKSSFWNGCWQVMEGNKIICTNESSQPLTDMTVKILQKILGQEKREMLIQDLSCEASWKLVVSFLFGF